MPIRDYLTTTLGLGHVFMLQDSSREPASTGIFTTGAISTGSFVADPVCEGVTASFQSVSDFSSNTAVNNGFIIGNTNDINGTTNPWQEYTLLCWFKSSDVSVPTSIYEQGGGTNNHAINVGIARAITSQAADAGQPFLIAQSSFLAEANRPYFVTHVWQRNAIHGGTGNRVLLYINGILQQEVQFDGTDPFPGHGGDIVVGNTNDTLQSYNGSTQRFVAREKNVNMMCMGPSLSITQAQAREIFERSVIPDITIPAGTVASQQAALDALSGNTYSKANCKIRIVQATDATDYRLFIDNIKFEQDENLKDISIQYVGPNTLTLENANGSDVFEISTPAEVDLDGTTVLPGGGTISILQDTVRLNLLGDISNLSANKVVIEVAGDYVFNNVIINEVENVSGGAVNITSDLGIPVVTNTGVGSVINLLDSFLSFSNSWELYATREDRDLTQNLVAAGGSSDTYPFTFSPGTTYYLWIEGVKTEVTPLTTGETEVNLSTSALLSLVNENLSFIDRVVYCDTRLSENGNGTNISQYNSLDDAITKYNEGSYTYISLKTDIMAPATTSASLDNVKIRGANPMAHLVLTGNTMNGAELDDLLIQGVQGPTLLPSTYKGCSIVGSMSGLVGKLENIQILSLTGSNVVVQFAGSTALIGCNVTNVGSTTLDIPGGASVAIRNITGSFIISSLSTGSTVSVDSISGNLVLDSSCTGGSVRINDTIKIIDNSAGTTLDIEDLPTLSVIEASDVLAKKADLTVINEGVKKASLSIPHNDNI